VQYVYSFMVLNMIITVFAGYFCVVYSAYVTG